MKLSNINTGMDYSEVRRKILYSKDLTLGNLPAFCNSDYMIAENHTTKERVYILRDFITGIIIDVTTDISNVINKKVEEKI